MARELFDVTAGGAVMVMVADDDDDGVVVDEGDGRHQLANWLN